MLIRQACGVKQTHPFDDFPHYKEATKSQLTSASQVRSNFKAYIETLKALEADGKKA